MLTKEQAMHLMEQFKRATEYVWYAESNQLLPSAIEFGVIEDIINQYTEVENEKS